MSLAQVFGSCTHLVSLTIPPCVTNIGDNAFGNCPRLAAVYFTGNPYPSIRLSLRPGTGAPQR